MIPKKIHYCWLSDEPYPPLIQECIKSWKDNLIDYEFVKWDTKRFNIDSVPYVKEAFRQKKYAFCADYIRIYALYNEGGIYLDSDVMVHKSFDPFLKYKSFSSVEFHSYFLYARITNKREKLVGIEAAVLGAEPKCEWLKDVMDYYNDRKFTMRDDDIMPRVIARVLSAKYGLQYSPTFQKLSNDFYVFPAEIFSSKVEQDIPIKYSTHLGANSWGFGTSKWKSLLKGILLKTKLIRVVHAIRGIGEH